MFKMSPEELRQILWSYITTSEVDETFYCILEHRDGGGEGQVWTMNMIILTSLLQLAQSSVECMIPLMMAQAAGERLRSGVGRISRRSGGPRA